MRFRLKRKGRKKAQKGEFHGLWTPGIESVSVLAGEFARFCVFCVRFDRVSEQKSGVGPECDRSGWGCIWNAANHILCHIKMIFDTIVLVAGLRCTIGASRMILLAVVEWIVAPLCNVATMLECEEGSRRHSCVLCVLCFFFVSF